MIVRDPRRGIYSIVRDYMVSVLNDPIGIYCSDALQYLKTLPSESISACVTDPPYGLSFMGKKWDYDVPSVEIWAEVLRVLKPGAHLLAFAGTRTQHRMAVRIEDAGFEIRDMIAWVYGSGFPKSLDVSKAIDREAGAVREKVQPGNTPTYQRSAGNHGPWMDDPDHKIDSNNPVTESAKQWSGWGTALKPALEPITMARKPFSGTVAQNVQRHGTAAMNVDGCRVGNDVVGWGGGAAGGNTWSETNCGLTQSGAARPVVGRWPANLIHDGSVDSIRNFPGEESRFFYCAKASRQDRGPWNRHPTVKPTELMRHLIRLVTPPGGIVLDPFLGSGSTAVAAYLEGFRFVGCDMDEDWCECARKRIDRERGFVFDESGEEVQYCPSLFEGADRA